MESVMDVVDELFPTSHIIHIPCTDISRIARSYCHRSSLSFVGGTNILSNNILKNNQWQLNIHNLLILKRIVLLGCGWFQYECDPLTYFSKKAYRRILSSEYIHSVRDKYTRDMLEKVGIESINTGCPTLWRITPDIVSKIPCYHNKKVIVTLTDYNRDQERDLKILKLCESIYDDGIIFFPQGVGDIKYLQTLGYADKVKILHPRLSALDTALESGEADYVGTRLHAGIRALQKSVRSFIVGIDNRSIEMGKDFSLPVLNLDSNEKWRDRLLEKYQLKLSIPFSKIKLWKKQFQ